MHFRVIDINSLYSYNFYLHQNEYTDWERPPRNPLSARDATLEFLSDGHTAAPLVRLGYMHSLRGGRTYFLHFRHQSGERDFPQVSFVHLFVLSSSKIKKFKKN